MGMGVGMSSSLASKIGWGNAAQKNCMRLDHDLHPILQATNFAFDILTYHHALSSNHYLTTLVVYFWQY
jgi:hypothetical protein